VRKVSIFLFCWVLVAIMVIGVKYGGNYISKTFLNKAVSAVAYEGKNGEISIFQDSEIKTDGKLDVEFSSKTPFFVEKNKVLEASKSLAGGNIFSAKYTKDTAKLCFLPGSKEAIKIKITGSGKIDICPVERNEVILFFNNFFLWILGFLLLLVAIIFGVGYHQAYLDYTEPVSESK